MTVLSDLKAVLVADVTDALSDLTATETVSILDYEPRQLVEGRITVTVTLGKLAVDYITFITRVYCPFSNDKVGEQRLEAAVEAITNGVGSQWLEPDWEFGWDERLNLFAAQGAIATPRGLGT